MAKILYGLGRWSYRFKWAVMAIWAVVFIIFGVSAATMEKGFSDQVSIPGTESQEAVESLLKNFPDATNPLLSTGVTYVFAAPEGHTLSEYTDDIQKVFDYVQEHVKPITNTTRFGNPVTFNEGFVESVEKQETSLGIPEDMATSDAQNLSMLSKDGRIGFFTFDIDADSSSQITNEQREEMRKALTVLGDDSPIQVEALGSGFDEPISVESRSEIIGLAVAFIVLLITFGSLVAATMPLITAIVGVAVGVAFILIMTHWVSLNNITPVLSIMIGLAVGIDYALFILSRYRAEIRKSEREEAAGMAVGTAGSAVVFAGITVIIALAALSVSGIPFLTYMGAAAAFTVFVAVLVALTLVPAVLGLCGKYAFGVRLPRIGKKSSVKKRSFAESWVRFVHRHPASVFAIVVFILGALTLPIVHMDLALPSDKTSSQSMTQRRAADLLEEGFGAGINAPFLAVVDAHSVNADAAPLQPYIDAQVQAGVSRDTAARTAAFLYAVDNMNTLIGVSHAQLLSVNSDYTAAQIYLTPTSGPAEQITSKTLSGLRQVEKQIENTTGISIGITGLTPIQVDVTNKLESSMPLYLLIVVSLAIILLLMVFRSIMVPLVAALGFLLSVGAAFGLTVLFWQDGLWGLVDAPGPLISFMPIFLIGVTFGLAMDYQVFLVSRMRERYVAENAGLAPGRRIKVGKKEYNLVEKSIIEGFSLGSRVVTGAAIIMISVFVAFIDQSTPFIKVFGFALGAGVLFDAFFIRMTFVPATMFLLGHTTWWIPHWLDKILPHVDVEGEGLVARAKERRAQQDIAEENSLRQLRGQ